MKKNILRKIILNLIVLSFLISPIVISNIVTAQDEIKDINKIKNANEIKDVKDLDLITAIKKITNIIFTILILAAVIALIIAGFLFITSAGDTAKVDKARDFVIYAVVGVVVALLAKGLVNFVQDQLKQ